MSDEPRSHTDVLAERLDLEGLRVADVGCGDGGMVRWLRDRGAEVVGVECGEIMRARALAADPDHVEDYLDGVGQDLPLDDDSCDVVIYSNSLHHVPVEHMDAAIAEARRVLRPGGSLFVFEPIAAGPLQEVVRIVDDETGVRAEAQDALDRAGVGGFATVEDVRYPTEARFADAETFAGVVVGVSPSRAEAMAANRADFDRRFEEHGTPVEDGRAFPMEHRLRVLRAT